MLGTSKTRPYALQAGLAHASVVSGPRNTATTITITITITISILLLVVVSSLISISIVTVITYTNVPPPIRRRATRRPQAAGQVGFGAQKTKSNSTN